ncbi:MAG: hypothetical protein WBD02_08755 [Acidimicrobiia bacterium]
MTLRIYAPATWSQSPRFHWLTSQKAIASVGIAHCVSSKDLAAGTGLWEPTAGAIERDPSRLLAVTFDGTVLKNPASIRSAVDAATTTFVVPHDANALRSRIMGIAPIVISVRSFEEPKGGAEEFVYRSSKEGAVGIAAPHSKWSKGLVALCHRFDVLSWSTEVLVEREFERCVRIGVDAVVVG